jgi:predicted dehydrogenase
MSAPTSAASARLPIAVIGAGGIGRFHIERALASPHVSLAAIADPTPAAEALARSVGVPWFADHRLMLERADVKAAIVATPNTSHVAIGLDLVERRIPALIEKPIADAVADARRLVDAARAAGVPLMTGHHRRCNPIIRTARRLIDEGVLGRPVSVTAMCTWLKPDPYYEVAWRREPGGGPILINLIHDVDLLRHLVGEIASVQAVTSSAVRGFPVEDTAAVIFHFDNGALGTVSVSDTAVAPWNWDLAAGEAAHYPQQDVNSHYLSGTEGSLTLPRLEVWRYRGTRGWHEPLSMERIAPHLRDPYAEQLRHLRAVVEGAEAPLCSGEDGLRTLAAVRAVHGAAAARAPVAPQA